MSVPRQAQQAERDDQPHDQRQQRGGCSPELRANKKLADDHAVDRERDSPRRHRMALQRRIIGSMAIQSDGERRECDGRGGSEKSGETLGAKNIAQHGEGRHDDAPDQKADDVLAHFAFFQSFDSGPPFP